MHAHAQDPTLRFFDSFVSCIQVTHCEAGYHRAPVLLAAIHRKLTGSRTTDLFTWLAQERWIWPGHLDPVHSRGALQHSATAWAHLWASGQDIHVPGPVTPKPRRDDPESEEEVPVPTSPAPSPNASREPSPTKFVPASPTSSTPSPSSRQAAIWSSCHSYRPMCLKF